MSEKITREVQMRRGYKKLEGFEISTEGEEVTVNGFITLGYGEDKFHAPVIIDPREVWNYPVEDREVPESESTIHKAAAKVVGAAATAAAAIKDKVSPANDATDDPAAPENKEQASAAAETKTPPAQPAALDNEEQASAAAETAVPPELSDELREYVNQLVDRAVAERTQALQDENKQLTERIKQLEDELKQAKEGQLKEAAIPKETLKVKFSFNVGDSVKVEENGIFKPGWSIKSKNKDNTYNLVHKTGVTEDNEIPNVTEEQLTEWKLKSLPQEEQQKVIAESSQTVSPDQIKMGDKVKVTGQEAEFTVASNVLTDPDGSKKVLLKGPGEPALYDLSVVESVQSPDNPPPPPPEESPASGQSKIKEKFAEVKSSKSKSRAVGALALIAAGIVGGIVVEFWEHKYLGPNTTRETRMQLKDHVSQLQIKKLTQEVIGLKGQVTADRLQDASDRAHNAAEHARETARQLKTITLENKEIRALKHLDYHLDNLQYGHNVGGSGADHHAATAANQTANASLRYRGDTVWSEVSNRLRSRFGHNASREQITEATKRVLRLNGLRWNGGGNGVDVHKLPVGFQFKIPANIAQMFKR